MSKEENETYSSPEEGFSASEDEWKPCKDSRGGESSDDDDSDFEGLPNSAAPPGATSKKRELKGRSVIKQNAVKKRKSSAQSLRSRMYNKYKPPPKTLVVRGASNSPSASTSKISDAASKNAVTPNDGSNIDNDNESSDSSGDDYLVNPAELDLNSSFFDGGVKGIVAAAATPSPHFDCNAGMNLSDSGSEDNNDTSECEAQPTQSKAFDFRNLLEKANDLERAKEAIAKRANSAGSAHKQESQKANSVKNRPGIKDVETLLALGENQANQQKTSDTKSERQKSRQTKATRQKRSTKTKTTGNDTEDSDWEEVAGMKR